MSASELKHPVKPFIVLARLFIKSEDKAKLEIDRVKAVVDHEFGQTACDSYVFTQPREGDKTILTVFESYADRDYAMNGHRNSDAFKAFREVVAEHDTRKSLEVKIYTPKGGFLWRPDVPKLRLGDQFIWIAKFRAHPGKRDDLIAAALTHTNNVHRTEDETLSFLVLESNDDDVSVVLFERYTSEEYFEKVHKTSETMQQFRANIAPFLAERESEGYVAMRGFLDKREARL